MTRRGIRCSDCGAARLRKCETWRTLVSRGVGMDGAPLAVEEARTVVPARGRGSKQMAHEILRGATKDRVRRCPASSQGYPHVAAYRVVSRHSWNHGLSRHRVGRVGGVEVSPFLKADAEPIAGAARVGGGGNVVRLPLSAAASNRSMACRARPPVELGQHHVGGILQRAQPPTVLEHDHAGQAALAMPSLRQSSAMLASPRNPSRTMRIFSSAEYCRRVARRMSRTVFAALSGLAARALIVASLGVTMSPNFSLRQSTQSVP